ncbi:MFS transporter [Pseudomonas knackmussii]|uniref:MFS transporter n=1 Tax=Pseudomonas knackmussii TaxID=65741 RepID=UPI003F4A6A7C
MSYKNSKNLGEARAATSAMFFVNGMVLAIWATNIPGMKEALALSDQQLGMALSAFAAGTMLTLFLAGSLVTRLGSRNTSLLGGALLASVLPLSALASSSLQYTVAVFLLGVANSVFDVAMNTHGSIIEGRREKPLMSSFHAVFSIGGLAGASAVATLLADRLGPVHCLSFASAMVALTSLMASRWLGKLEPVANDTEGQRAAFAMPNLALLAIAGLTFLALFIERTVIDWSSLYLTDVTRASASIAAFAFGAFSLAMAVGRLSGDRLVRRFGQSAVLSGSGALGAIGLVLSMLVPQPLVAIIGFVLVGLGLSNMIPTLYSRASRAFPGAPGLGLAMNGTLGYVGFLIAPPVIGFTSSQFGLKLAMLLPMFAFVVLMICTRRASAGTEQPEIEKFVPVQL